MNEKEKAAVKRTEDAVRALESDPRIKEYAASCRTSEKFYLGEQWGTGEGEGLTKPVFNVIRRVCDYVISSLCAKEYSISYSLDDLPPEISKNSELIRTVWMLTAHISTVYSKEKLEKLIFDVVRDAVIFGSGVMYTHWDAGKDNGDTHLGGFLTSVIDPACLYPSDVSCADVQSQDYFIIKSRVSVRELRREAKTRGISRDDIEKITNDNRGDGKADVSLMLSREEDGRIHYFKTACGVPISYGSTGLELYPIAVFTPTSRRNRFFGESMVSGMIPNQQYINRAYCMLMKHMQDTAFSKVIYDKTKIPEWTGEPGVAIGAHGGGNLSDSVAVVGCGELGNGYMELSREVIDLTRELHGATDAALGNVDPNNSSAILAAKESAAGILRGSVSILASTIEDQARIWAETVCTRYGTGRYVPLGNGNGTRDVDFGLIRHILLRSSVDVSDEGKYGTSTALAVLDKLLNCGAITPSQYIERLPKDIIPKREELIREINGLKL